MPNRQRSIAEKTTDWSRAFNAISDELTPAPLRTMLGSLQEAIGASSTPVEAMQVLQSSMALARLISANDRAAAISAAILTSGGGARPVVYTDAEDEG